ncbi:glycoside hydrolase [Pirellulaceae bacterium SH449]
MQRFSRLLFTLCAFWLGLGTHGLHGQIRLVVDLEVTYQTIDSFGASDAWSINPIVSKWMDAAEEQSIDHLADLLFSTDRGIGLSGWRFNIGAGSASQGTDSLIPDPFRRAELLIPYPGAEIDSRQQVGQIRMLREAHQRGVVDFVAFANSPPYWATKNGLTHPNDGNGIGSTNLDPNFEEAFAGFLVEVVNYLRSPAVGVPVNYLSPINEPTWDWRGKSQEGCPYNVKDIKSLYRAIHTKLVEKGLAESVHVDGVEAVEYTAALSDKFKRDFDDKIYNGGLNGKGLGKFRNYIPEFLGDPEMRAILENKISLHGYFSDAWPDRLGKLRDTTYENVKQVSPDAKIWMSEFCILGDQGDARPFTGSSFEANDMQLAIHIAKVMHRDLVRLNVSAWHWWLAVTPYDYKDGLLKIAPSLEPHSLETTKAFWALGHYSRFVRPGYVRVKVDDPDDLDGLMVSAFKSPDGETLVYVLINASEMDQHIILEGSASHKVYLTDENANHIEYEAIRGFELLPKSITTVIATTAK